jgi:hypothetical protein
MEEVVPFGFICRPAKLGDVWTSGSLHFVFLEIDQLKSFGKKSIKEKEVNGAWPTQLCGPLLMRISPRPPI